ncbi:hypothetical protein TcG_07085 [Trypanosoma cruzi]|nr:hypothetical protein TcG_07085 [Trypanosoma cruzi]
MKNRLRRSGRKRCTSTKCQYHPKSLEWAKLSEVGDNHRNGKNKLGNGAILICGKEVLRDFYIFLDTFVCAYGADAPAQDGSISHRFQNCPTLSNLTVTEENQGGKGVVCFLVKNIGWFSYSMLIVCVHTMRNWRIAPVWGNYCGWRCHGVTALSIFFYCALRPIINGSSFKGWTKDKFYWGNGVLRVTAWSEAPRH